MKDKCKIELKCCDCMDELIKMPDKAYDLAIVDPPYGTGDKITAGGTWSSKYNKSDSQWNKAPDQEYFNELFRVSKNQIIWGGNYFSLPPNRGFVIWEKLTISESFSMSMAEYAWMSFDLNSKIFKFRPQNKNRFHPTQKPVELYKWLLSKYAKSGNKILDTHLGSGSIAIACWDLGFDLTGFEKSEKYFSAAAERLKNHQRQGFLRI
jgi:site-specific DNA-methyltransferase (adenine-specific)